MPNIMIGAITGDIIGSVHEYTGNKTTDFPWFVAESHSIDDTVLAVAVADCLWNKKNYAKTLENMPADIPMPRIMAGLFIIGRFHRIPSQTTVTGDGWWPGENRSYNKVIGESKRPQ
ncbi:MAG: hypothetical protein RDU76_09155, partial [Candidatus Edwardsbacteria bacterium]|nr:hypothetical protein [Candidatus Edwardsbacteria bacterium]